MTLAFPSRSASLDAQADAILKTKEKINWHPIEIDTLPADHRQRYEAMRAAQQHAASLREAFEDNICADFARMLKAQPGQDVVFTYRFGPAAGLASKRTATTKANALRF